MWRKLSLFVFVCLSTAQISSAQQDLLGGSIEIGYGYHDFDGNPYDAANNVVTHLFFKQSYYQKGSVYYLGRCYDSVRLKYDIQRHILVTLYSDGVSPMALFGGVVDSFIISNHHFVRLENSGHGDGGFYDHLYGSKSLQFYGFYSKSILPGLFINGELRDQVDVHDTFF